VRASVGSLTIRTISRTFPSNVTTMCSGIGGNGNAPKAGDVGDMVGDEVEDDVGESIVIICRLLEADVAGLEYALVLAN